MSENPEETGPEESYLPDGVEEGLRNQHGPLVVLKVDALGVYAFHRMPQAVNDRMHVTAEDGSQKLPAVRQAVLSCLCYPVDDAGKPDYAKCRALFEASCDAPAELLGEIKDLSPKLDIKKR